MDRSQWVIAFLTGVCVALGAALVVQSGDALPRAHAQASGAAGGMVAVTGTGTSGQSRDVLFLLDSNQTRLAVYEYKDGRMTLGAVRNIEFDLRFNEFPGKKQTPSVKEMKELSEKQASGGGGRRRR